MAEVHHGLAILTVLSILVLLTTSSSFAATINTDLAEISGGQDQTETKQEAAQTKRNKPKKRKAEKDDSCIQFGIFCLIESDDSCCTDLECDNWLSFQYSTCGIPLDFKNQTTTETL